MRIKVLILGVALFAGMTGTAQIQRKTAPKPVADTTAPANPAMEPGEKIGQKKALKELQLTKEQKQKIKALRNEAKERKEKIENNDSLTATQKEARLKEIKKEQAEKLKTTLTDEQKAKLIKMKREERLRKKQGE